MGLRLVLGRAGSGKTARVLESMADELAREPHGPSLVLLVPEQATFQMEQALLDRLRARHGRSAFLRAEVLSFQRLAWRVLSSLGGESHPAIGQLGKRMLLRSLLHRHADELQLLHRVGTRPGFIAHLADTLAELSAHQVGEADLVHAQSRLAESPSTGSGALTAKLNDLAILTRAYREALEGRWTDPDGRLSQVAARLAGTELFDGATVWVDGFTGFTPQELAVIEALLAHVETVEVTLCLDPREVDEDLDPTESELFRPTHETYRQLHERATSQGVSVEPPVRLPSADGESGDGLQPRYAAPALAHLERELGQYPGRRFPDFPEGLGVLAAPDRRAEVEAAAREVLRLARDDGMRYRDIVLSVRELDVYHDLIEEVFPAHGIPVFIDRRRSVAHHPVVELIRSALETVQMDWAYEPVFRYLKTDLTALDRDEVDRLENYVLEFGIRGWRWRDADPWQFVRRYTLEAEPAEDGPVDRPEDADAQVRQLAEINEIRDRARRELWAFHERVTEARRSRQPVGTLSAALYGLLADLGVAETVEGWSRDAEAADDLIAAQEHLQVWDAVVELLDQTIEGLEGLSFTLAEYAEVIEAGLEAIEVGLIPPGTDQVVVGTVERSRHPHVRAALVLGAVDGAYPKRQDEDPLLNDREREALNEAEIELQPTARVRTLHEPYFTYVALTRASERLWISYPRSDDDGKALRPAPLVRRLEALYPQLAIDAPSPTETRVEQIETGDGLAEALVTRLRAIRDGRASTAGPWLGLYDWAVSREEIRPDVAPALAGLTYRNDVPPLSSELVEALFGSDVLASPSRLESFAKCPFQHFARYGLRLTERPVQQVEAPELGLLYHAALSTFAERTEQNDIDLSELDDPQLDELMSEIVAELAPRLQNEVLTTTARYRYLERQIRDTLLEVSRRIVADAHRGRFRPVRTEVRFGPAGTLPPIVLDLGKRGQLTIRGAIDRVDLAAGDAGERWLRVVDYKTRPQRLNLDELYHGISLQLGSYVLAALQGQTWLADVDDARFAGLLYLPIGEPVVGTDGPLSAEEAERERQKAHRADGWLLDDESALSAMDESGAFDMLPVRMTQQGRPDRRSRVLSDDDFERLLEHLDSQLRQWGEQMLEGVIEPKPIRHRDRTPCEHCDYRAVCQFEPRLPGNRYRELDAMQNSSVLETLRARGDGPSGDASSEGEG
ncbi:MAG: helicase-exonuclease AddAB subunit AddB [Candidatus Bipolaricaulia bacterium]